MILSRQCCLVALVAALTFHLVPHPFPFHSLSLRLRLWLPCLHRPLRLFLNIILILTIAVHRTLQTVSTLMQAYRTSRSCEGCGDLCVRRLVREVSDIGLIASSVLELLIWLHDCRLIVTTGGDDCMDLCASLFRVCGRYGSWAQKSRETNDPSGGYGVLVSGIVMISTVGEAILLEGTASMHADEIDVGVSAISQSWDLATSVCSEYFFSAEIG